ncbi:Calvin cycle protein CP12 [Chlorogloeopsis sp. ULAP01]|uniref:Calvin cycle protein CP12 n=1 Tax=Chlorogloeopsis sp. ULAP01 TaxID=3056483 RepID=UPI0025AA5D2F|nr:Calvin cycle protein CP12 [Chlorogloeopsis sp. ULAP01]MDM9384178.1 Calvin cycle protein CP12 [Chlorogloeopsis sp. ULAP01]
MAKSLDVIQTSVPFDIEQAIAQAVAQAHTTCEVKGNHSTNCAVAWEIVEELQAEKFHQLMTAKKKTALEIYCETHPDAAECRIYDV